MSGTILCYPYLGFQKTGNNRAVYQRPRRKKISNLLAHRRLLFCCYRKHSNNIFLEDSRDVLNNNDLRPSDKLGMHNHTGSDCELICVKILGEKTFD
jgi:hypothetical protein